MAGCKSSTAHSTIAYSLLACLRYGVALLCMRVRMRARAFVHPQAAAQHACPPGLSETLA